MLEFLSGIQLYCLAVPEWWWRSKLNQKTYEPERYNREYDRMEPLPARYIIHGGQLYQQLPPLYTTRKIIVPGLVLAINFSTYRPKVLTTEGEWLLDKNVALPVVKSSDLLIYEPDGWKWANKMDLYKFITE